ncbi:MAG: hypothetical protein H8E55_09800 [Pelagibacterales bacterium]|nr:hypothetical protein [Pelagibacterales bacterium]
MKTQIELENKVDYHYEELTLAELADRYIGTSDFTNEEIYNVEDLGIEVLSKDEDGNEVYVPILNYIVKHSVDEYYTDGKINVTGNHRFVENEKEIFAKDHPEFTLVDAPLKVVDIEVDSDEHTYLANGRNNHNTTSGGKAIPFHASIRLRLKSVGQIKVKKDGVDMTIGIKTRCQVIKNRMGPPLKTIDYDIYFESGIDNYGGWLNVMKTFKLVNTAGAWYTFTRADGTDIKFLSKDFEKKLTEIPGLKDEIYETICESYILKYKPGEDIGIDDVEIDEEFVGEES